MESLYTKYRPATFEQVVGQKHVVETLEHAVLEGRTSHAYLFCGPRGTGKTTMARILAKALVCKSSVDGLPCGDCEDCHLIATGDHPDVIELDAASNTGVDNVREEIISRVNYAPVRSDYKVYIIDEVHMLTPAAFNALLKTIEEPPAHVVFIMCTTDPQKILATVLSRVQRFDFHAIGADEMQAHLAFVCSQEGFSYDEVALELITRHARGGMRDALTSLEQISTYGGGSVTTKVAQEFLGEVSGSVLGSVTEALARRDVPELFDAVGRLVDKGRDLLQFSRELAAHVRDVYVVAAVGTSQDVIAGPAPDVDALQREARAFGSVDRVARVLTVLGDASNDMRTATNQRLVLEIAFTRIARPETELTLEALAERVADLERQVDVLSTPGAVPTPRPAAVTQPVAAPQPAAVPQPVAIPPIAPAPQPAPVAAPSPAPAPVVPPAPSPKPTEAPKPVAASALGDGELQRRWRDAVNGLVSLAPSKGSLLLSSTAVSDDGSKLTISLPKGSHFAARMLERSDVREIISPVIAKVFGPRELVYVESSLANQAIARADKAAAVPTPQPVAQPAPAPQAVPAPAPATVPQPAPAQDNPMPWDPVPEAAPEAADAAVPYDDVDVTVYEEDYEPSPVPAPVDVPAPAPPAPTSPAPAEKPSEPAPAARKDDVATLPKDLTSIVSMLEDAFGQSIPTVIEGNEDEVEAGLEDEGAQDDDSGDGGGDEFSSESDYDEDDFEDADE